MRVVRSLGARLPDGYPVRAPGSVILGVMSRRDRFSGAGTKEVSMSTIPSRAVMQVDGRTVHCHAVEATADHAGKPAVILVHAGGSTSLQWKGVLETLAGRWDAAAIDLHGIALTSAWSCDEAGREMEVEDEARLVLDFAQARFGTRQVHLVGHSYGASVALCAARLAPERLASLTIYELQSPALNSLLAPASPSATWVNAVIDRFLADMAGGDVDQAMAGWTDEIVHRGFWRRQDEAQRRRLATVALPGVQQMHASKRDRTRIDDIIALALPLVLITGGGSPLHFREPTEIIRRLRRRADDQVVVLHGASHLGPQTHAAQLADVLEACWPAPMWLRATG